MGVQFLQFLFDYKLSLFYGHPVCLFVGYVREPSILLWE